LMNKDKWNSLPPDVKDVLEKNSGKSMSLDCGRAFAGVSPALKKKCVEAGVEVVDIPESDRQKMRDLVKPLRKEWVEEMNKKGLKGQKVLDKALQYLEESKKIE
ncbi:MAG: hypothetical protein K9J79_02695, partial [Desulfobacteraceae bacterium]|nr:hypothetical protein [Desulfobacteraceae bacterium]